MIVCVCVEGVMKPQHEYITILSSLLRMQTLKARVWENTVVH